ncbi:MAG TPA: prephenate dehydratase [Terriglobales bacterium]|nr:prephenate dehydratase [Terriglobales bacterium]
MDLDDWRSRINNLDNQILNLLNQRAEAALKIGDLKRHTGAPVYVPEREVEVLKRVADATQGPLTPEMVRAVWREVLSACRAVEAPITIAFLAPPATFTHQAALQRFGESAVYRPVRSMVEIFDEVERGDAAYGVVPVENSTEGAVNVTLDRLVDADVVITGECYLDIAQHLLSRATDLGGVKRVLSHPQGLAQCRRFLTEHLRDVPTEATTSTAAAVEIAAEDATVAAIASELAGRMYGVPTLRARIEDNRNNSTRFLVIGRRPAGPTGRDKTSILFAMPNTSGALHSILEPFARRGLNLTKIESRPARQRPFDYVMFVDFEGHRDTPAVESALADVRARTLFLKVLGSYPAA